MIDLLVGLAVLFIGPLLVIWWLPYLVHELGHLLGATLAGARFDYIPLGPLMLARRSGPRRLRWQIRRFACGSTVPVPGRSRAQLFAASVGGPALNIGIGVVLLAVALFGDAARLAYLVPLVLLLVGLFMALHGLMWLLPWRPYGVPSDGIRLWSLLTDSAHGRRWTGLKEVAAFSEAGVRPREWPAAVVDRLVVSSDGSIDDVAGALNLYWHLLDSRRLPEARACLEQARAAASQRYMTEVNSQIVLLELAFMESREGADPALAVMNFLRSAFIAKTTLLRVAAAIHLSYANLDASDAATAAARSELITLRSGFALMEADLLTELQLEVERRREGAPVPAVGSPVGASAVDVTRFATPDVPMQEPAAPPGLRSSRTLVGLVASGMVGLAGYAALAGFARGAVPLLALVPAIGAASGVVRVRASSGKHRIVALRTVFAALAVLLAASPVLVGDLLRLNGSGYIWIAGQARPCTAFGTGHDLSALWVYLFALAIALGGLLIGTRARNETLVPRVGVYLGMALVAFWIVAVASDHAHFAAVIGCGS